MSLQVSKRLFSTDEYHRLGEVGVLTEDDRVELIGGEIVQMIPIGSGHAGCVKWLAHAFNQHLCDTAIVSVQDPVSLGAHDEPQPDVALLQPRADCYRSAHPTAENILLVVEVADTSAAYDREMKIPLYARFGIREAWVVDITGECVECYLEPSSEGYRKSQSYQRGQSISPNAFSELALAVDDILG